MWKFFCRVAQIYTKHLTRMLSLRFILKHVFGGEFCRLCELEF